MRAPRRLALAGLLGWTLVAWGLGGCGTRGSGTLASEVREVSPFHAIDIDLTGDLSVTLGSPQRVAISVDDNLLAHVRTTVDDRGVLRIDCDEAYVTNTRFRYEITVPTLDALSAGRGAATTVTGLDGAALAVSVGWETFTTLGGRIGKLTLAAGGRAKVDASGLVAAEATVAAEENALVKLRVTDKLTASARQRAGIEYAGDPQVTLSTNGKGKIRRTGDSAR